MKKFTKVSLLIVAVMASLGLLLCGISAMFGGGFGPFWQMAKAGEFNLGHWRFDDGVYYDDDNNDKYGTDSRVQSFPVSSVVNMVLDIDLAELEITEASDAGQITVSLERGYEKYYSCMLEGDTLLVSYNIENHNFYRNGPKITVGVPEQTRFETLNFNLGAAETELAVDGLACEDLIIDVGAGTVTVDNIEVKQRMDLDVGLGKAEINGGTYQDVVLDCGMGTLFLEGAVKGDLTGTCGVGNIELELKGRESDYNYDLDCGMGNLEVNDISYSGIGGRRIITNEGAIGTMKLDCSMGKLEVTID